MCFTVLFAACGILAAYACEYSRSLNTLVYVWERIWVFGALLGKKGNRCQEDRKTGCSGKVAASKRCSSKPQGSCHVLSGIPTVSTSWRDVKEDTHAHFKAQEKNIMLWYQTHQAVALHLPFTDSDYLSMMARQIKNQIKPRLLAFCCTLSASFQLQ